MTDYNSFTLSWPKSLNWPTHFIVYDPATGRTIYEYGEPIKKETSVSIVNLASQSESNAAAAHDLEYPKARLAVDVYNYMKDGPHIQLTTFPGLGQPAAGVRMTESEALELEKALHAARVEADRIREKRRKAAQESDEYAF